MAAYYNEIDPDAADWIELLIKEGLIPNGVVDRRSIADVSGKDLEGFTHVHFFAGIAGWARALRLAGWPDDRKIWTGSCPCQPWSCAGKSEGEEDERHLWPEMFRLIEEQGPETIFGEQVASSDVVGRANGKNGEDPEKPPVWLDGVFADLERASYAGTAFDLPAACVSSPQIRQRIFWLACASGTERRWWNQPGREHGGAFHASDRCGAIGLAGTATTRRARRENTRASSEDAGEFKSGSVESERSMPPRRLANDNSQRFSRREESHGIEERSGLESSRRPDVGGCSDIVGMEHAAGDGRIERGSESSGGSTASRCGSGGLEITEHSRRGRRNEERVRTDSTLPSSPWGDYQVTYCRDDKYRRISSERSDEPLAYGIPASVGPVVTELQRMGHSPKDVKRLRRAASQLLVKARRNRVVRLKGYGNAIVDVVAAEFIKAFMELEMK